jgi:transcriptional regulator with XRE-family HTH domain
VNKRKTTLELRDLLCKNLKAIRQQRGISQEKLAELASLHRTYISSVERGQRNISIDNIERIAKALEISAEALLKPSRK